MRRTKRDVSFLLCLLINMLLNLDGLIPAAILLVLHFWLGWSIWLAVLAIGFWIIDIIFWMNFVGWTVRCSNTPDPPKENKNPYSSGKYCGVRGGKTGFLGDSGVEDGRSP